MNELQQQAPERAGRDSVSALPQPAALERPTALLAGCDGVRMPGAFRELADESWCTQLLPGSGLIDVLCAPAAGRRAPS